MSLRALALASFVSVLTACSAPGEAPTPDASPEAALLPPDGSAERPWVGLGVITEIRGDIVQIDHETIPGFMVALTMDFPLADPAMARGLSPGDSVRFSIEAPNPGSLRIIAIGRVD